MAATAAAATALDGFKLFVKWAAAAAAAAAAATILLEPDEIDDAERRDDEADCGDEPSTMSSIDNDDEDEDGAEIKLDDVDDDEDDACCLTLFNTADEAPDWFVWFKWSFWLMLDAVLELFALDVHVDEVGLYLKQEDKRLVPLVFWLYSLVYESVGWYKLVWLLSSKSAFRLWWYEWRLE